MRRAEASPIIAEAFEGAGGEMRWAGYLVWMVVASSAASQSGCIRESSRGGSETTDAQPDTASDTVVTADTLPVLDTRPDTVPDTKPDTSGPECGDGACDSGETRLNCAKDCGCGNGTCEAVENEITCPLDCCGGSVCGDCNCDAACGETEITCPRDCWACGDGVVSPGEIDCGCILDACRCPSGGAGCGDGCCMGYLCGEGPQTCAQDCGTGCGNSECEPGETPVTCAEDCAVDVCGNGLCESGRGEDAESCSSDCAAACGNCECEPGETYLNCPPDCGLCGDGVCSNCPTLSEREGCFEDCGPNEPR